MGFLDRLFGAPAFAADPRYLLIECMVDVMLVDRDLDEAEIAAIRRAATEHEYLQTLPSDEFDEFVARAQKRAKDLPKRSRRIENLAESLPARSYRLAAYALACQVACADRNLTADEKAYLEELRRAFMLDEATAQSIFSSAGARAGLLSAEDSQRASFELTPIYLDCMALMVGADGQTSPAEVAAIKDLLTNNPDLALGKLADADREIAAAITRTHSQNPEQALAALARERLPKSNDRFWALVYMACVASADGRSDWRETKLLESARASFGLSDEMFAQALRCATQLRVK